jgi:release factor glutamine methyltransferase
LNTVRNVLHEATKRLRLISPTARLDAEMILAHVLGTTRERILADFNEPLAPPNLARFERSIERRLRLEPVAYLIGEREFYGLSFHVDARVLVPRPETELLVERTLQCAREHPRRPALRIADIGTGSGAIAIAVATHLPASQVWAVDLSGAALEVARTNVERHRLEERITLIEGDGLAALPGPVDLLLTNPPYTILAEVDENVRRFEPHVALDGGPGGLALVAQLIATAPPYLRQGVMLIEIGSWQGQDAMALARSAFPQAAIRLHQDLAQHDRLLEIRVGI